MLAVIKSGFKKEKGLRRCGLRAYRIWVQAGVVGVRGS